MKSLFARMMIVFGLFCPSSLMAFDEHVSEEIQQPTTERALSNASEEGGDVSIFGWHDITPVIGEDGGSVGEEQIFGWHDISPITDDEISEDVLTSEDP